MNYARSITGVQRTAVQRTGQGDPDRARRQASHLYRHLHKRNEPDDSGRLGCQDGSRLGRIALLPRPDSPRFGVVWACARLRHGHAEPRAVTEWADGTIAPPDYDEAIARSRDAYAKIVGCPIDWLAITPAVSVPAGHAAALLNPGETVLVAEEDFSSVLFPFLAREGEGIVVRQVPVAELIDHIDASVEMVAVSAVPIGRRLPHRPRRPGSSGEGGRRAHLRRPDPGRGLD